jgi:hypothetical protein
VVVPVRKPSSKLPSWRLVARLAGHFGMGAALGMLLGLCLVRFDIARIREMIESNFDPSATLTAFIGSLILHFGIGATLTGYIFQEMSKAEGS